MNSIHCCREPSEMESHQPTTPRNSAMFISTAASEHIATALSAFNISRHLQFYTLTLEHFPNPPTAAGTKHSLESLRARETAPAALGQEKEPIAPAPRVDGYLTQLTDELPLRVRYQHVTALTPAGPVQEPRALWKKKEHPKRRHGQTAAGT